MKILIKQRRHLKIIDILSKHKPDFAHISAYSADNATVNFGKFGSVSKLTKENEQGLPAECPVYAVYSTASANTVCYPLRLYHFLVSH